MLRLVKELRLNISLRSGNFNRALELIVHWYPDLAYLLKPENIAQLTYELQQARRFIKKNFGNPPETLKKATSLEELLKPNIHNNLFLVINTILKSFDNETSRNPDPVDVLSAYIMYLPTSTIYLVIDVILDIMEVVLIFLSCVDDLLIEDIEKTKDIMCAFRRISFDKETWTGIESQPSDPLDYIRLMDIDSISYVGRYLLSVGDPRGGTVMDVARRKYRAKAAQKDIDEAEREYWIALKEYTEAQTKALSLHFTKASELFDSVNKRCVDTSAKTLKYKKGMEVLGFTSFINMCTCTVYLGQPVKLSNLITDMAKRVPTEYQSSPYIKMCRERSRMMSGI